MRRLAQPAVLKSAALAAIAGAALSYPRMALWPARAVPLWYVEAVLFLCGTVLWGFVFAWHEAYSQRPVFTLKIPPAFFAIATIAGVVVALGAHFLIDPALRTKVPDDYPRTYWQWTAMTLFDLAFVQLFLLFAPFAWLLRLLRNRAAAIALTVLLCAVVLVLRSSKLPPLPFGLFAGLLLGRVFMAWLALVLYLRGGVLLVWWLWFLTATRHLIDLSHG